MTRDEFKELYPNVVNSGVSPEEFHKQVIKMNAWDGIWKEIVSQNNLT